MKRKDMVLKMINNEEARRLGVCKKMLTSLLTIASCVCLLFAFTACGGQDESGGDDSKAGEKVNEEEVYKEVFAALGQCYLTGEDNELISADEKDAFAVDPTFVFAMKDFDENGIKEMIVGNDNGEFFYPTGIYSIKDNHPILLPTGYIYTINSEGVVEVSGDGENTKEGSYEIKGEKLKKVRTSPEEESTEMEFEWYYIPHFQFYAKAYTDGLSLNEAKDNAELFSSIWIKRGEKFYPSIAPDSVFFKTLDLTNTDESEEYDIYYISAENEKYEQTLGPNDQLVEVVEESEGTFTKMEGSQGYTAPYTVRLSYFGAEFADESEFRSISFDDHEDGVKLEAINDEILDTEPVANFMVKLGGFDEQDEKKAVVSKEISKKGNIYSPNKYLKLAGVSTMLVYEEDWLGLSYLLDMKKGETIKLKLRDENGIDVSEKTVTATLKYLNYPDDFAHYKSASHEYKYSEASDDGYLVIDTKDLTPGEYVVSGSTSNYYLFVKED